jgi:lipoyl-dependent peroxiredoxin
MATRRGTAVWEGSLTEGSGRLSSESGALLEAAYSFPSRFQEGTGTNPEELIAAAHAGCFSMALAHGLAGAGHAPTRVTTEARVHLEKGSEGFSITRIELVCEAVVPGIDDTAFQEKAQGAKKGCPVSRALGAVPIELKATLAS